MLRRFAGSAKITAFLQQQRPLVNVSQTTDHKFPPLHAAAKEGNIQELKRLLSKNARVGERDEKYRFTPLHTAAIGGSTRAAEYLIDFGADPSSQAMSNSTPTYLAAAHGHDAFIKFLLTNKANSTIGAKTILGRGTQHQEIINAHVEKLLSSAPTSGEMMLHYMRETGLAAARPPLYEITYVPPQQSRSLKAAPEGRVEA